MLFWFAAILFFLGRPVSANFSVPFGNFSFEVDNYWCEDKMCFRRCCQDNQGLIEACVPHGLSDLRLSEELQNWFAIEEGVFLVHSDERFCREPKQPVPVLIGEKEFTLVFKGNMLHLAGVDEEGKFHDFLDYCFDFLLSENVNESALFALVCVLPDVKQSSRIDRVGMIISMPFLLVTFLVYLLLPDRNLHQKALMFYVLALFFAYILLVTINLSQNISDPWCSVVGYATLFSFMVSFFWMNVICFDIWYTFSGGRGFAGSKKSSERKRLIVYGVYAFGMPLLLIVLIYVLDIYLPENSVHRPDVGHTKCFLSDGWANLWYFYGEAGILVLANIIFFALTALKIRKVKQETSMLKHSDSKRHSYEKDKQNQVPLSFWFNLYVKLLFAMGVNWSMEVISWLVNWQTDADVQYIFYITDFFNAVYGVWIFLIFVFKRKIWMLLKKRYYNLIGKPHLAHTVTSTQTRTSNYSSTNYSTADTHLADRGSTTNGNGRQVPEEVALRQVT